MQHGPSRHTLEHALAQHGLVLRGGWIPSADDHLPRLPGGSPAAVVWMVGQVGSRCWPVFAASPFARDGLPDPMDRWSRAVGESLAGPYGGAVVMPSDGPPYAPFPQWARRAEPELASSPLRLQIHPRWGLWHAWRFALLLPVIDPQDAALLACAPAPEAAAPVADRFADMCLACDGQPCLSACPVDAFTPGGYDVAPCAGHLLGGAGGECRDRGCLARRACPVGAAHRYAAPHAAFHMAAFVAARRPPAGQAMRHPQVGEGTGEDRVPR